ncbi:MAG: TetR/AcrR family transcriptional regulator [Melioribacteraceae bacterium]|nr:TetR/AcrR family transcriptional regulator [Melioribacteraceae bacterium]
MGIAERREREKEQRRLEIIHAAESVFFSKGFSNATMDDVAAEAELSKGTLYIYFKSKEEIYLEIVLKAMRLLKDLFEKGISGEPNGLCKTRAIGEAYIKFNKEYPNYYRALLFFSQLEINDNLQMGTVIKAFSENKDVMNLFINVIKEGIDDGSIRADIDPKKTALLLWGETSGILQLFTLKGHVLDSHFDVDPEEMIRYFMNFTYHSLKAE